MLPAIRVENLSKQYRLGARQDGYATLRESLTGAFAAPFRRMARYVARDRSSQERDAPAGKTFWALRDISFEVQPGEVVGIIGRNGAGKSTLLKILSRVTEPTNGRVELRGRVGSLLEVGTGFHHELTGRENIFMNGSILGMSRREIARKFDEIVAFSGVEAFIDTPVKRYSSGMFVRLAFAVAAHMEPEVLLVDEVLAVGDLEFQKKCLGRIDEAAKGGRTVFLVSHHMPTIRNLTSHTLYMESGRLKMCGHTADAIQAYLDDSITARAKGDQAISYYRQPLPIGAPVQIERISLNAAVEAGEGAFPTLKSGSPIHLAFDLTATRDIPQATIAVVLTRDNETTIGSFVSSDRSVNIRLRAGRQRVRCQIGDLPLAPGQYSISVRVSEVAGIRIWDAVLDFPAFVIDLPASSSGELQWPSRPWGAVYWSNVDWTVEV